MPIGKYPISDLFDNHFFEYQKNDVVFSFSDGISDQMNSEGIKFGTKQLLEIVKNSKNSNELKNNIINTYNQWKGSLDQLDDVLFFSTEMI